MTARQCLKTGQSGALSGLLSSLFQNSPREKILNVRVVADRFEEGRPQDLIPLIEDHLPNLSLDLRVAEILLPAWILVDELEQVISELRSDDLRVGLPDSHLCHSIRQWLGDSGEGFQGLKSQVPTRRSRSWIFRILARNDGEVQSTPNVPQKSLGFGGRFL